MTSDPKAFASRLRELRSQRGMPLRQLATLAHLGNRMLLDQAAAMHARSTTRHPADAEELRTAYRELLGSEGWPTDLADPSPHGEVVVLVPPEQYGWLSGGC